jgi:hypothetical protein
MAQRKRTYSITMARVKDGKMQSLFFPDVPQSIAFSILFHLQTVKAGQGTMERPPKALRSLLSRIGPHPRSTCDAAPVRKSRVRRPV